MPQPDAQYPLLERHQILHFGYKVIPMPDGGMLLMFSTPGGVRYELPFDKAARDDLGRDILAPSILKPGA